jgi:N-acetylmuramoyl-L-alanine amidase
MRRTLRAAALTAVALSFATAGGLAGPSLASQSDAGPTGSYTEHAGTTLTADLLGLNDLQDPTPLAEVETPVATHAVAPVIPQSILQAEDAEGEEAPQRDSRSLAQLVNDYSGTETPDEETECLARGVYWESKGEPLQGQLTVAEVIINRARSGRFASTICGVIRQRGQFSFVRGGVIPRPAQGSRDWRTAVAIAQIATQDLADGAAPRALFFHARHARPGWRLTRVATVGNHVFYR